VNAHRTVRCGETVVRVAITDDGRVQVGELLVAVEREPTGGWRVTDSDGHVQLIHAVTSDGGVWTHVDGRVFVMDVGSAEHATKRTVQTGGSHDLSAPMPATVLSIVAAPGTSVAAGDALVILEAMKMELPIRAPRDGTVKAIHCTEGQLVQAGVTLVELA